MNNIAHGPKTDDKQAVDRRPGNCRLRCIFGMSLGWRGRAHERVRPRRERINSVVEWSFGSPTISTRPP